MKKLVAFVMAMAITAMAFGQMENIIYPGVEPVQDSQDRTGWIGGAEEYDFYFKLEEGTRYCMRLPAAGELPAGNLAVTKVAFRWQPTANGLTFDPNFRILIYAGGNGDWIDPESFPDTVSKTPDMTVQGTLLHTQTYYCPEIGWQTVELTRSVGIPANQEVWIAIEALGNSCCLVCPDLDNQHPEWYGQHLVYKYIAPDNPTEETPVGYYWAATTFIHPQTGKTITGKFALRVLIDDGQEYVNTNDWDADIYSLETAPSQTSIDYIYIDQFMMEDSLYLFPGLWNNGPDSSISDGRVRFYIENTEIVYADAALSALVPTIVIGSGQGWTLDIWGGLLKFSDMEEMGLSFPFDVCFTFEPEGFDPNLSNNRACVQVTDVDPTPDGLSESANTLSVSPNPANTSIKVENAAGSRITVYNIAGQEVLSVASAEANETLNVSDLKAGLYIVRVTNGNEVSTAKVSIVR